MTSLQHLISVQYCYTDFRGLRHCFSYCDRVWISVVAEMSWDDMHWLSICHFIAASFL